MTRLEYLLHQFETVSEWYRRAENKARFAIGLDTVLLGVVNGLVFVGADEARAPRGAFAPLVGALLVLAGGALAASCLLVLQAVRSRHGVRDAEAPPAERIWFFGDIAEMSRAQHREIMAAWNEAGFGQSLISQIHVLSRNVTAKYVAVNLATAFSVAALLRLFALGLIYGWAVATGP
jgi:hypothetical protein